MPRDKRAEITARRERVAQLALRGLSQREIIGALTQAGLVNSSTGNAYGLGTINRDLKALRQEWRERAAQAIDEHRASILAKLDEVERAAWGKGKLPIVLKALDQKAGIIGVKQSQPVELSGILHVKLNWGDNGSDNGDDGAA